MMGGSQPSNKTRFRDTAVAHGGQWTRRWAIRRDQRNYDNDIEHEMLILLGIQRTFPEFTCHVKGMICPELG